MIVKARVTSSLLEELANGKFISAAFGVTLIFSFLIVPRSYKNPFLYFSVLFFFHFKTRNGLFWELSGLQYHFNVYLSNFQSRMNK